MKTYTLRVEDLAWTKMIVTVKAESEQDAVQKVLDQSDDVDWGVSEVFWEGIEKQEIHTEDRTRKLYDSDSGFVDVGETNAE